MQVDVSHDIDLVMPMYKLTEYSDNYSKTSEIYGNIVEIKRL